METRPTSTKGPKEKKLGLGQHSTFAFIIIENYHNI